MSSRKDPLPEPPPAGGKRTHSPPVRPTDDHSTTSSSSTNHRDMHMSVLTFEDTAEELHGSTDPTAYLAEAIELTSRVQRITLNPARYEAIGLLFPKDHPPGHANRKTGGRAMSVGEKCGSSNLADDDEEWREFFRCKICYSDRIQRWVSLPCGHRMCFYCKQKMSICPFCRTPIREFMKIRFACDETGGRAMSVGEKSSSSNLADGDDEESRELFRCKICYSDRIQRWMSISCGHLMCVCCKQKITICPFCRTLIREFMKIRFAFDD